MTYCGLQAPPHTLWSLTVDRNAAVPRTRQNGSSLDFLPYRRVRGTAAFLTTVDFYHDLRGLRHPQLTFYALKPTAPMNCEPRKLTRPRRGRSGPIYAQNFEIAAVIA